MLHKKDGFGCPFFISAWGFVWMSLTFHVFAAYWQTVQSQNWQLG